MINIKLMELLETDTQIEWWNTNRKRLNEVLQSFNDLQIIHKFDEYELAIVKAKIELCRKFGDKEYNSFSDWQFEILDEMEAFLKDLEDLNEH